MHRPNYIGNIRIKLIEQIPLELETVRRFLTSAQFHNVANPISTGLNGCFASPSASPSIFTYKTPHERADKKLNQVSKSVILTNSKIELKINVIFGKKIEKRLKRY